MEKQARKIFIQSLKLKPLPKWVIVLVKLIIQFLPIILPLFLDSVKASGISRTDPQFHTLDIAVQQAASQDDLPDE